MQPQYSFLPDLVAKAEIPAAGTHSQTIHEDSLVKAVLFGFAADEELTEHSSSKAAMLHVLSGQIALGLGKDRYEVGPGAWTHMQPNLPHTVRAESASVVLLLLFKQSGA